MLSVGIKELKDNPSMLTKAAQEGELSILTKRGKPIGIVLPWSDEIMIKGYKETLSFEAYKNGLLTLSQLSEIIKKEKAQTLQILGKMNIAYIDHQKTDIDEELAVLEKMRG
jgi:antitoxin (DNA-binding transcriptional repressor) of toxin-antitoxin stability system